MKHATPNETIINLRIRLHRIDVLICAALGMLNQKIVIKSERARAVEMLGEALNACDEHIPLATRAPIVSVVPDSDVDPLEALIIK